MDVSDKTILDALREDFPSCSVCFEILGTYGGPASLPCGHNGCLNCLQEVFLNKSNPLCPLCRANFDPSLRLGLNLELKSALEKAAIASQAIQFAAIGLQKKNKSKSNKDKLVPETFVMHEIFPFQEEDPESDSWISITKLKVNNSIENSIDLSNSSAANNGSFSNSFKNTVVPTAPPEFAEEYFNVDDLKEVLEALPPQWLPDSSSPHCMQCSASFKPLRRSRHHCRFCGGLFCNSCSKARLLLPVSFSKNVPQRVCNTCRDRLKPVQRILIDRVSNAAQVAVHDITDFTSFRSWVNSPLGFSMEDEIFKATNTLHSYSQVVKSQADSFLRGAKGLAIVTVLKAGMYLTYKFGTGLVLSRRSDGSWSAPSSICTFGLGWGPQVGGQISDFIIVLRSEEAVKAFCGLRLSFGLGAGFSAGPIGRSGEKDIISSEPCLSYSCSKGAFIGVSLEYNIIFTRISANLDFYGDSSLKAENILLGDVVSPRAALPLYSALEDLFSHVDHSHSQIDHSLSHMDLSNSIQ